MLVEVSVDELCRSQCVDGFRAWEKNYPLRSIMVCHDHERIKAVGWGEVRDEVDCGCFERICVWFCWDWHQWRRGRVSVDFCLLADCTAREVFFHLVTMYG